MQEEYHTAALNHSLCSKCLSCYLLQTQSALWVCMATTVQHLDSNRLHFMSTLDNLIYAFAHYLIRRQNSQKCKLCNKCVLLLMLYNQTELEGVIINICGKKLKLVEF